MWQIGQTGELFTDRSAVDDLYSQVIRGDYKQLRITIREGKLRITAPQFMREKTIRDFLAKRLDWIHANLQKTSKQYAYRSDMRDGGIVYLYGHPLTLRVDVNAAKTAINRQYPTELIVASPTRREENIREAVTLFLKERYIDLYNERAPQIIAKMSKKPSRVLLSNATKSRWGVCNSKTRVIRLSWRVVCLPVHCFDYLLTHELAHLEQANHSKAFWAIVENYCPDYKQSQNTMRSTHPMVLV